MEEMILGEEKRMIVVRDVEEDMIVWVAEKGVMMIVIMMTTDVEEVVAGHPAMNDRMAVRMNVVTLKVVTMKLGNHRSTDFYSFCLYPISGFRQAFCYFMILFIKINRITIA